MDENNKVVAKFVTNGNTLHVQSFLAQQLFKHMIVTFRECSDMEDHHFRLAISIRYSIGPQHGSIFKKRLEQEKKVTEVSEFHSNYGQFNVLSAINNNEMPNGTSGQYAMKQRPEFLGTMPKESEQAHLDAWR